MNVKLDKMVPRYGDSSKTQIPIVQGYCEQGRYMTLFDIGTGGGSTNMDARRGWERRLFGTRYDGCDQQRPRYGNLNLMTKVRGDVNACWYGQSYLVLKKNVRARCTMTSRDSCYNDAVLGTLQHPAHVLKHTVQLCRTPKKIGQFLKALDAIVGWKGGPLPPVAADLPQCVKHVPQYA